MSIEAQPSVPATRSIEVTIDSNRLLCSPLPALADAFATTRIEPDRASHFSARLSRRTDSLLGNPGTPTLANAGLADAVIEAARRRGYEVQVSEGVRFLPLPIPAAAGSFALPHVLDYVSRQPRSVVLIGKGVKSFEVVAQFGLAHPSLRMVAMVATRKARAQLLAYLRKRLPEDQVRSEVPSGDDGGWLAVPLPFDAAEGDLARSHVLILPDASTASHEAFRQAISTADAQFRIVAVLRVDQRLSPFERDRLFAACGPFAVDLPAMGQQAVVRNVAWLRHQHGRPCSGVEAVESLRQEIHQNPLRNRRMARLAELLAAGSSELREFCPSAWSWVCAGGPPAGTMILLDSLEQAACLLDRLSESWAFIGGQYVSGDFVTAGLRSRDRELLLRPRSAFSSQRVVTTGALASGRLRLQQVEAIVWAGGGPSPPEIPAELLQTPVGVPGRLLIVDVKDQGAGTVARWSRQRAAAYRHEEFFEVGESPESGRIRDFLDSRPRSGGGRA